MSRAVIPAVTGIALGTVVAVLASGVFPAGFARSIEPNPGLRADFAVLAVGAASLLVGLLVWVGLALLVARHHSAGRPWFARERIARSAPSPTAATGIRFALSGSDAGAGTSTIGRFGGLALLVAGVVGAITFAVSLDRLVTDHARFGSNFTFLASPNSEVGAADMLTAFQKDADVDGLMVISGAQVRVGEKTIGLIGVEHVKGDLAPRVLSGRLPSGPDEISMGRVTARQLHLKVGDDVALEGSAGRSKLPRRRPGRGPGARGQPRRRGRRVATAEGLLRLEAEPDRALAVLVRPGAPANTSERLSTSILGQPAGPGGPAGRDRQLPSRPWHPWSARCGSRRARRADDDPRAHRFHPASPPRSGRPASTRRRRGLDRARRPLAGLGAHRPRPSSSACRSDLSPVPVCSARSPIGSEHCPIRPCLSRWWPPS